MWSTGVSFIDINNDGWLDLYVCGFDCPNKLYINDKGTFIESAKEYGLDYKGASVSMSFSDFDRDGDVDFVITHWTEDFASVFLNRGDGTFAPRQDHPTGLGNYGVDVADLDRDGNLDIVTANYREKSFSILFGKGQGAFKPAITKLSLIHI